MAAGRAGVNPLTAMLDHPHTGAEDRSGSALALGGGRAGPHKGLRHRRPSQMRRNPIHDVNGHFDKG
jgi:hypothetical protein